MSERRQDEIDAMFKKTSKPKLVIDELPELVSFASILDNTPQGKNALFIATNFARQFAIKTTTIVCEDFYDSFRTLVELTNEKLSNLVAVAKSYTDENQVSSEVKVVMTSRISKMVEDFQREVPEEEKLGSKLINKVKEENPDILVLGVPLFQTREDASPENLGNYVTQLLRDPEVRSNILLVSKETDHILPSYLSFVTVNQQPGSIAILSRRALSMAMEKTEINIVGIVEDSFIETMARVESEEGDEEELTIEEATKRLRTNLSEKLDSISIEVDVKYASFNHDVKVGKLSSVVKNELDAKKPGLVLVRSVSELGEHLDPIAEKITRIALADGYPVLIIWD